LGYEHDVDDEQVVERYDVPHEAELAAAYLRDHGIDARVDNDVLPAMNPLWSGALGAIRVHVPAARLAEASELLASLREPREVAPSEDADHTARRALISAVFSLFICPVLGQLYSLWLVSKIRKHHLSPRGRRHRSAAVLVDVATLVLIALALLSSAGTPPSDLDPLNGDLNPPMQ
jgi:hypothetical protein